jgi:hypothetical protein
MEIRQWFLNDVRIEKKLAMNNKYISLLVLIFCFGIAVDSYGQNKILKPLLPHFKGLNQELLQIKKDGYSVIAEYVYEGKNYRAYYNSDTILEATAIRMDAGQCPSVVKDEAACSLRDYTIQEWLNVTSYSQTGTVTEKSFRVRIDVSETNLVEIVYDLKLNRIKTDFIEKEKAAVNGSSSGIGYQGIGAGSNGPERISKWYKGSSLKFRDDILKHVKLDPTSCVKRFAGPRYLFWVEINVDGKMLKFNQAHINITGYAPLVLTEGLEKYLKTIVFPKQPFGSKFQYEVYVTIQPNGSISVEIPDYVPIR